MTAVILVTASTVHLYPHRHLPRLTNGLVGLLHQCDRSMVGAGVVLVDQAGLQLLGLPDTLPAKPITTPALADVQRHGWRGTTKLGSAWLNFHRNGSPSVAVLLLPYLRSTDAGDLVDLDDIPATLERFDLWHQLTGAPWTTSPGTTGINLMREKTAPIYKGAPIWCPDWSNIPPAARDMLVEQPLRDWVAPTPPPGTFKHGYDANRARLQYFGQTKFARGPLQHTFGHIVPADLANYAGYVRIERPTWSLLDFPHPAGYRNETAQVVIPPARKGAPPLVTEWVAVPTAQLLLDVADQGYCEAPRIHEGYVAPAATLWRRWADTIENVWQQGRRKLGEGPIKEVYRQTSGQLRRGGPRMDRKDWYDTLISSERSWLWRKWFRAYLAGFKPLEIQTDAVWYLSDHPGYRRAVPNAGGQQLLPLGDGLGQFHPLGSTLVDGGDVLEVPDDWADLYSLEGPSVSDAIAELRALRTRA